MLIKVPLAGKALAALAADVEQAATLCTRRR
jgi:hypothetical protein